MGATGQHKAGRGITLLTTKQRLAMAPPRPTSSWWVCCDDAEFTRRWQQELPRMEQASKGLYLAIWVGDEDRPIRRKPSPVQDDNDE